MRVLEHKVWKKEIECNVCHSRLEILAEDIRFWVATDYGGGTESGYDLKCPECKTDYDFKESELPSSVKNKAREIYHANHRTT